MQLDQKSATSPSEASMMQVIADLLAEGQTNADIWQALVDEGLDPATATNYLTLAGQVLSMLKTGTPNAEIWQTLVDRGSPASTVTAAVAAMSQAFPPHVLGLAPCSECGKVFAAANATWSPIGEPICNACVNRRAATELNNRVARSFSGPEAEIRICPRCKQPSMTCVQAIKYVGSGGGYTDYTFACSICGDRFTASDSNAGVGYIVAGIVSAMFGLMVFSSSEPGRGLLPILMGFGLGGFGIYKMTIWSRYPVAGYR